MLKIAKEQMQALNLTNKRQKSSIFITSKSLETATTANKRSRSGIFIFFFICHRIAKGKHTIETEQRE